MCENVCPVHMNSPTPLKIQILKALKVVALAINYNWSGVHWRLNGKLETYLGDYIHFILILQSRTEGHCYTQRTELNHLRNESGEGRQIHQEGNRVQSSA